MTFLANQAGRKVSAGRSDACMVRKTVQPGNPEGGALATDRSPLRSVAWFAACGSVLPSLNDFGADERLSTDDECQRLTVLQIVVKEAPAAPGHTVWIAKSLEDGIERWIMRKRSGNRCR